MKDCQEAAHRSFVPHNRICLALGGFVSIKLLVSLTLFIFVSTAHANCKFQDVSGAASAQDKALFRAAGEGWLINAKVCAVGAYEIAVPANPDGPNDPRIMILSHGRPVLKRDIGTTLLYNPDFKHADLAHPIVYVEHGKAGRDVDRMWYRTIPDKEGHFTLADDRNFDGQADTMTEWKGATMSRGFAWYGNQWHPISHGCITIVDKCHPAKFEDGQWHLNVTK